MERSYNHKRRENQRRESLRLENNKFSLPSRNKYVVPGFFAKNSDRENIDLQPYFERKTDPEVNILQLANFGIRMLSLALKVSKPQLSDFKVYFQEGVASYEISRDTLEETGTKIQKALFTKARFPKENSLLGDISRFYVITELPESIFPQSFSYPDGSTIKDKLKFAYYLSTNGESGIELVRFNDQGLIEKIIDTFYINKFQLSCWLKPNIDKKALSSFTRKIKNENPDLTIYLFDNFPKSRKTSGNLVVHGTTPAQFIRICSLCYGHKHIKALEPWRTPTGPFMIQKGLPILLNQKDENIKISSLRKIIPGLQKKQFKIATHISLAPPFGFGIPVIIDLYPNITANEVEKIIRNLEKTGFRTVDKYFFQEIDAVNKPEQTKSTEFEKYGKDRDSAETITRIFEEYFILPFFKARWQITGTIDRSRMQMLKSVSGLLEIQELWPAN